MNPTRNRKLKRTLVFLLILFVLQETTLRIAFPVPEISNFDRCYYVSKGILPESRHHLRNQNWYWMSSPDTHHRFVSEMNLYGFRDDEWSVSNNSGKTRVLFLGDSFVEGIMAEQHETIPTGFKNESNDIEVMNAGVLGVGPTAYLQLATDMAPIFKPDIAIMCIYANDLGQNVPIIPTTHLKARHHAILKPRFMTWISENSERGPLYSRWHSGEEPYLLPFVSKHGQELTPIQRAIKQGTFNGNRVGAIEEEAGYLRVRAQLGACVPYFVQVCKDVGTEPIIVYIPSKHQLTRHYMPFEQAVNPSINPDSLDLTTIEYQRHAAELKMACKASGVAFLDLTPILKSEEERKNHLYWNYDEHMRGTGYLLVGREIRKFATSKGLL